MTATRTRAGALLAALVLVACAVSSGGDEGERSRLGPGGGRDAAKQGVKQARKQARAAKKAAEEAVAGGTAAGEEEEAITPPEGFGEGDEPSMRIDPSLARASASVSEPEPVADKSGLPADYPELLEASIEGLGENVRLTWSFAGNVPERMPKDTYMVIGIGITGRGEMEGYALGAHADDEGWNPYAGGKGQDASKFPGSFEIKGDRIVIVVPWSAVHGPRAFKWYGSSSWFSQVAGTSSWSYDPLPNKGAGRFPN